MVKLPDRPPRTLQLGLAGALLALCLALVAWPLDAGTLLGGHNVDGLGSWWFQWWVDHRIAEGLGLGHATELFHPVGKDILGDTGANLVDPLLALPLRRLFGPRTAWNLLALGILGTNGLVLGGWAWRRAGLLPGLAALVIGVLHPYPLYELSQGRPTQALLAPLLLALALGDASFGGRDRRWLLAGLAGLALGLAGYTYWFGMLFGALALAVLAAGRARSSWAPLLVVAGVSGALAAPLLLPLLLRLQAGAEGGVLPVAGWWTELVLVTASGDRIAICTLAGWGQAGFLDPQGWEATAPVLGLGTAALAVAAGLRERRWWWVAGLALVLAVGPRPLGVPNPLYLALATAVPGVDRLYWPCRAMSLSLALVAPACVALSERGRAWVFGPLLLVLASLGWRGSLPLPTWSPEVPAAASCLAGAKGAVIDLPFARDHEPLLYQTVHERPLLDGMNPRSGSQVPEAARMLVRDNGWLHALVESAEDPRARHPWEIQEREAARELGFRWVLVRLEPLRTGRAEVDKLKLRGLRVRLEELVGPPVLEDEQAWLFDLGGEAAPCRDSFTP